MNNAKPRYDGIDIQTALDSIATAFNFDADALIDYAAQDPHGGYHPKEGGDGFPIGSIWRVEGQILYALVLHMAMNTPGLRCVEFGTHYGCSATHIAQALHDANNGGTLICVDLNGAAGNMIPSHLLPHVEFVRGDMFDFLAHVSEDGKAKFDFILEDGSHGTDDVEKVWRAAYHLLKPGGLIVSHDAEHFVVGADVREGIARAGFFGLMPPARTYLIEPSDCGFAFWRKPHNAAGVDEAVLAHGSVSPVFEKRKNDEVSADVPSVGELMGPVDLSAMTIAQLKSYADRRGISLTGLRTKGEIIAAIEAA